MARACLSGAVAALLLLVAPIARAASLDVLVQGVRNGKGDVRVAVCTQTTFLADHCAHAAHVPAHPGDVLVRIDGVPPGVYAVQAFHDEDGNGEVTRNLLGLPTEGLGFSNDAAFKFGPPSWTDARFRLGEQGGRIKLRLRYLF